MRILLPNDCGIKFQFIISKMVIQWQQQFQISANKHTSLHFFHITLWDVDTLIGGT